MYLRKYWNKPNQDVIAIEPYATLIGTDGWPLDPDPIKRFMDDWLQELRRNRPQPRYKGQFVKY